MRKKQQNRDGAAVCAMNAKILQAVGRHGVSSTAYHFSMTRQAVHMHIIFSRLSELVKLAVEKNQLSFNAALELKDLKKRDQNKLLAKLKRGWSYEKWAHGRMIKIKTVRAAVRDLSKNAG